MARAQSDSNDHQGRPAAIGIKLGSTRTVLAVSNGSEERVVQSLTCLAEYDDPLTQQRGVVFGDTAAEEYTDRVEFMLRTGLPEDDERAEMAGAFLAEFVKNNEIPQESVAVYAIPSIGNQPGLENLQSIVEDSPVGDVAIRSYPESLCAALPAMGWGLDALDDIFIAINMGSTNLEVAAYRRGEQLSPYVTGSVTGTDVDRAIAANVEAETQGRVKVDLTTAREYKEQHADFDNFQPFTKVVQQPGGGSHEYTVEQSVMEACNEYLDDVVEEVADRFLPELASNSMKIYQIALSKPIVLTGGMACIPGIIGAFEDRLSMSLQRDVEAISPQEPRTAAAEGAQRIAQRLIENGNY